MKNSKICRGICYLLIPILVAIIILSSFYIVAKNEGSFSSEEEFFNRCKF
ncbi:MAG: hypothetical protein K1W33_06205 [Clostridia bacterium]|nr:hypothetical protein [Clostridia bacterium]